MRFQRLHAHEFEAALAAPRPPFVVDVRKLADYEAGHVPGSRHVPVHELPARRPELPSSLVERIIVIGEPGKRADAAANWLVLMGYGDVAVLDGGIDAYEGELEQGPPPPPPRQGPELKVVD